MDKQEACADCDRSYGRQAWHFCTHHEGLGMCSRAKAREDRTMSTNRYMVVKTAFHSGGVVSTHKTRERAEEAARRWRGTGCMCGCCGVVDRVEDGEPEKYDPYEQAHYAALRG